jgi:hypothetical protein
LNPLNCDKSVSDREWEISGIKLLLCTAIQGETPNTVPEDARSPVKTTSMLATPPKPAAKSKKIEGVMWTALGPLTSLDHFKR